MVYDDNALGDIEKATHAHYENSTNSDLSQHPVENEMKLSPEHYDYLMQRHGTIDLDPLPSADPKDPLNWPNWQKNYEILNIALSTFSSTFMAAGVNSAYEPLAELYGVSMSDASYFTSVMICVFGVMPFIWVPLMNTYGRKPFLTTGALFCCALNIGSGFAKTYGQQIAIRVLIGVFIATATSAGAAIVNDLAFAHERGKKNGWWSLGYVMGTAAGSFLTGFIQYHVGSKWIFFVFAIMNFVQFLGWVFSRETVYTRSSPQNEATGLAKMLGFRKSHARKFSWWSFLRPWKQAMYLDISLAVMTTAVIFAYGNIFFSVEMPQTMSHLFHLNAQLMSLQFLSLVIGCGLGEVLAGPPSDWWMQRSIKKRHGKKVIVDRLWHSYLGFLLVIVGIIVFCIMMAQATPNHWTIKPLVGVTIAAVGNQIVTTVVITYAIDNNPKEAGDVGIYLGFWRQMFGFVGPFYFPKMVANLGFGGSAGLMCGIIALFSLAPTVFSHVRGEIKQRRD